MLEVLLFLFASSKDKNIYFNQQKLVDELVGEHAFDANEVEDALSWLAPVARYFEMGVPTSTPFRNIVDSEMAALPKELIDTILVCEREGYLNNFSREIIIDRLLDLKNLCEVDSEEFRWIFDDLVIHLQDHQLYLKQQQTNSLPFNWVAEFNVH